MYSKCTLGSHRKRSPTRPKNETPKQTLAAIIVPSCIRIFSFFLRLPDSDQIFFPKVPCGKVAAMLRQFMAPDHRKGQETIITGYCRKRQSEDKHKKCVILCLQRGQCYRALDIPIRPEDQVFGLDRLRRESGSWWKRYSIYSAIAVKEKNVIILPNVFIFIQANKADAADGLR